MLSTKSMTNSCGPWITRAPVLKDPRATFSGTRAVTCEYCISCVKALGSFGGREPASGLGCSELMGHGPISGILPRQSQQGVWSNHAEPTPDWQAQPILRYSQ